MVAASFPLSKSQTSVSFDQVSREWDFWTVSSQYNRTRTRQIISMMVRWWGGDNENDGGDDNDND